MKTSNYCFAIIFALALSSFSAFAQMDEHEPGVYTIVDGNYLPLEYNHAPQGSVGIGVGSVGVSLNTYKYKGATSGVISSDTFVLVIDPDKKCGIVTSKQYCFLCYLTPEDMLVLPLEKNDKKKRREYNPGLGLSIGCMTGNLKNEQRAGFEWEKITDNSFKITVPNLTPGEYCIILRPAKLGTFDYTSIFGFTIPEVVAEDTVSAKDTLNTENTISVEDTCSVVTPKQ